MELTLASLGTLAGAVLLIELVMELLWKPLVKNISFGGYADIVNNFAAFVFALAGTWGSAYVAELWSREVVAERFLLALAAAFTATFGYEVVKNIGVGVRNNLP